MQMAERCSEQVVVRIEPTLRRKLEDVASADRRSVGNLVRRALSDWLEQQRADTRSVP
jgi:predicted transcriptional regulator